jgi:hypothetical protein
MSQRNDPSVFRILDVLGDILRGGRHSRTTVARFGVSLPTADRWLDALEARVPGLRRLKVGRVSWLEASGPPRLFLKLCEKCRARVHSFRFSAGEVPGMRWAAEHSPRHLCEECTAKLAQCARILTSENVEAAIVAVRL